MPAHKQARRDMGIQKGKNLKIDAHKQSSKKKYGHPKRQKPQNRCPHKIKQGEIWASK